MPKVFLKYFIVFLFFTNNYFVFSQGPGCPNIQLSNANINCSNPCVDLVASYLKTGETTSYSVSSIPYSPPHPFTGGVSAFVGQDDIFSGVLTLPFTFCFYGNTYNQLVVGANGVISFNTSLANSGCNWSFNSPIPNSNIPYPNSINGAYHDIDPSIGGNINYAVWGATPCRTFVVNYVSVPHYSSVCHSLLTTQQIVIYESTNVIEVYIDQKPTCTSWNSGNAVIGIQNLNGTQGICPPGRNTGPWSASQEAWRFTPDGNPNYIVEWFDNNGVSLGFGDTLNVCTQTQANYTTQISYTSCNGNIINESSTNTVFVTGGFQNIPNITNVDCNGNNNGIISVSSIGSAGPYSYSWTGPNGFSSTTQTINNLAPGNYDVQITDASGCSVNETYSIIEPTGINITTSSVNTNCSNTSNGSIFANANGGIPPYQFSLNSTFTWQNSSIFNNLPSGTYSVDVLDSDGCIFSSNTNVGIDPPYTANISSVDATCGGGDGLAYVTLQAPTSGISTLSYCDSRPMRSDYSNIELVHLVGNSDSIYNNTTGLCDSIHNYTNMSADLTIGNTYVVNLNLGSCGLSMSSGAKVFIDWNIDGDFLDNNEEIGMISLSNSPSVHSLNFTVPNFANQGITRMRVVAQYDEDINIGSCDVGLLTLSTSTPPWFGATEDYSIVIDGNVNGNYLWSNGQSNDTIFGLSQGTYSVSVVDPLGCSSNLSINVNGSSSGMTVQELINDVTCNGGSDGSVTLNISGGVPPFSISAFGYNLILPSGMNTFTTPVGVPAGIYPYDIIDAAQCTVSSVITVNQPAQITSNTSQSTCGLFNWNGNIYTSSGIYQYFMPNASIDGCDSTAILDLTVNPSSSGSSLISACDSYLWDGVVYTVSGIYANVYNNALGCDSIHSLNLTIDNSNSGTSAVNTCDSYSWNGINYTQSGIYTQILTNDVGCDSTHTLNLILNSSSNGVSNVTNCGSNLWNGLVYTTSGTYTNTYTNTVGCDSIHTLNLVVNDIYNYNLIDTACGQYIFNSNTYVSSGVYIDSLISTSGCDSIITLILTVFQDSSVSYLTACDSVEWGGVWYFSSDTVSITGLTTNNSFSCDSVATAIITINNSTSNTTIVSACDNYQWTLNGVNYSTSGLYTEVSINSSGCTHTEILDLTINNSTSSNINVTECDSFLWIENGITYYSSGIYTHVTTNSVGCTNTATLNLTINNSSSTLTTVTTCDSYVWSNTPNVNYISSGIYISTYINPISGCLHTDSLDLTILNSSYSVDNVGSHCDSYTWIDGNTYTSSNNTASFVISNSVGCDSTITLDLVIYPSINVNASITDELCLNYDDGRIDLTVSGGLGNFSFNWIGPNSFSSLNEDIYNLSPGYYAVSIIDLVTSCSISNSFLVDTGFNMVYSKSHSNISCYGLNDGLIDISPINLISPSYSWSDTLISVEDRINLSAGVYTLRIDDNNCFSIDTFLINEPDSMFLIAQHPVASCIGSNNAQISLSVYGGIQNTSGLTYSYMWNNWNITSVNSNLSAGTYSVIVNDANNCELRDTFEILPYTVDIVALVTNIDCFGNTNGSIDLEVLSGYPIFSYSWDNGNNTQDLYNISAGTYSCNIVDALGCIVDTTFEITEPNPLLASPLLSHVTCYAGNDGSVSLEINGGTYPYNLDWGNIDTNYLFSGNYNYEIIDSNGCVINGSVFIDQPDSLEVTFSVVDVVCWGQPTGSINIQIALNSGTPPYAYSWTGPNFYSNNTDEDIDSLYAGTYSLTITDANGCTRFMEIVVDEPTALSQQVNLVPSIYSQYNIACKGENNGWIEAQISGGYLPFSFKWNTGETGDSIANLVAGTYTVDITDGIGCTISYTVVLTEPEDSVVVSIVPFTNYNGYEVSCYFATDGGIGAQVNGGTGSYTYEWNLSNENKDTINDLPAGFYELIAYDSNNCFDVDTVTLYAPDTLVLDMNTFTDTCSKGVGGVDLNVIGGVPPYLYNWSAGQNTEDVYDLFSGINSVQVVDQNDCKITDTVIIANIFQPIADFKALPDHKRFYDQLNDPIVFVDMTQAYEQRVINWNWDFGDGFYGSDSIVSHVYNEQGLFNVLLTITTEFNCIDTISYNVLIDEYELFIPNAFTPGISDNINSDFKAYGYGVKNFKMNIYTRWGERVFETEDFDTGWDGLHYLNGKECITGVYTYYIEVENIYGEVYKYENQVRLIR